MHQRALILHLLQSARLMLHYTQQLETCKNLYGSQVLSSWSVLDHFKIQHLGLSGKLTFPKAEDSVNLSINACLSVFANHKPNHTEAPCNLFSKTELNIRQRYSA